MWFQKSFSSLQSHGIILTMKYCVCDICMLYKSLISETKKYIICFMPPGSYIRLRVLRAVYMYGIRHKGLGNIIRRYKYQLIRLVFDVATWVNKKSIFFLFLMFMYRNLVFKFKLDFCVINNEILGTFQN